ncbi:MAG: XrtA system polysaccharide chain length determinant [Thiohalomonadaceae bacterium]
MPANLTESLRLLLLEAYRHRYFMVGAFMAVAVITTLVGVAWPRTYSSYSTVYVEDRSVIGPLMQGAAVQSPLADRAMIAREVIYGRKLLNQIVHTAGFLPPDAPSNPLLIDGIIEGIKQRTLVTNVGENLVRIEYTDTEAERAQFVAQKMAELFITESLAAKSRESETAYSFIDQQVKEYHGRLKALDQNLKEFRNANADARAGADVDSAHRLTELRDRLSQLDQELREAEIRRASLESQLSGEEQSANVSSRAEHYRARIAELQSQLDTMLLTYHENYPDVVRIKDQIAELEQVAAGVEKGRAAPASAGVLLSNPLYQELRGALYEARTTVRTINSRIQETRRQLAQEEARNRRIQEAAAELAERTRDYEVTTQIYQDLLRRREAARVSMNLDRTQEGVTMRVEEPAFLPHQAMSPPLAWFASGGILLGVLLPFGVLFGIQQADPRIRHPSVISDRLGLATLGVVRHLHTPREASLEARGVATLGFATIATLVLIGVISVMSITGAI